MKKYVCCSVVMVIFTFAVGQISLAQKSEIAGRITDSSGAVVVGANINLTNVDTGIKRTGTSNEAGYYSVLLLQRGNYEISVEMQGFRTIKRSGIELGFQEVVRMDFVLEVGEITETIEVTAGAPLIETAASNFSTTLENRTIEELPLAGRDVQQLVFLVPGVNNTGGPPGSNFGFNSQFGTFPDPTYTLGSNISVNGGQSGTNAWYLDGNLNLTSNAENIAVNPSPDSVGEFQVITNAFAAEYSRTGGGVFNVVLKSGTNNFHGNLYEFHRNDATNARNPFTSIDSDGKLIKDRQLRFNNFGGTVGGPVIIPKLYNGKDKTHFFFSWDTSILRLFGQQVFTVPTARMRQGDFGEDPSVSNGIWDPFSTVGPDANGLFQRRAFGTPVPGNPFGADGCLASSVAAARDSGIQTCNFATRLPSERLDPTAMYFMDSFPSPNFNDPRSGCPMGQDGFRICENFLGGVGGQQKPHNISIKFDHQWSEKSKYFFEWLYNPVSYRNYRVPWTGPTYPAASVGYGANLPLNIRNQIFGLGNTYTLNPTLINEFRYSFSRQFLSATSGTQAALDEVAAQSEVVQRLAPLRLPSTKYYPTPSFDVYTPGGGWMPFGSPAWVSMDQITEAHTILDNVTKIIGKHTLKTGFVYRLEHASWESSTPTGLGFYGGITSDPITGLGGGSGLAQFMLGALDGGSTGIWVPPYARWRYWGAYVQDDFRITPSFSLHVGLRWDLYGWPKARNWKPMSNFCLDCPNPLTGLKGTVIYEGDPEFPEGHDLYPANKNSFGPRFNFSWAPFEDRKTILRGGYGIFTSNAASMTLMPGQFTAPGWQFGAFWQGSFYPDQCAPLSGQCVVFPLSDTTTDKATLTTPPLLSTLPPAQKRDPLLGGFAAFIEKPSRDPMVQMWSLEVERELPGNMMVSAGYVGNHGTHLAGDRAKNNNYVHTRDLLRYRTAINANIPITDVFSGQTAAKLEEVFGSATLPRSQLLTEYPFYLNNSSINGYDGMSIYHGMNFRFQKKYSHGFSFIAAYTFSKKINNGRVGNPIQVVYNAVSVTRQGNSGGRLGTVGSGDKAYQDLDNKNVRTIAVDDIPHMFNVAASYELPFGSGKALLNRKGILNALLGGWKLGGNFNVQSGVPLAIYGPCNELTCRPNLVGDPKFQGNRTKEQRIQQWINPAAFEPVFGSDETFWNNYDPNDDRAWRFGTAGLRMPGLRSPGFWNLDTALSKRFNISESKYFEFRWEAFNALNHQNLGVPDTNFCLPPGPDGSQNSVRYEGCTFGRITNIQTDPRAMQFGLKFFF
jgi:hypothetical protein